jgi:outer membrane protein assembly factor BamB
MHGRIQWQANSGKAWTGSGPAGARGTPTIDGNRLYHENAHDEVVCLDSKTGKKIWGLNMASEYDGRRGGYGRAESLWIDGDHLICSPGGECAVAALDKGTGRTVWKSASAGEPASYVSPIVVEYRGLRMILTMSEKSLIGVNADSGDLLWRFEHYTPRYVANCVTPIYHDGHVFISGGYGKGSVLLKVNVDGQEATMEPVWRTKNLDNRHGGVILLSGYLYGASHASNSAKWVCLDWKTGQVMYAQRGVGQGSLACADGMLYTLSEHRTIGLVKPTPAGHQVVSQFKIPEGGEGPTWAHPVVCGGRLYVRHGDRLYAYDAQAR